MRSISSNAPVWDAGAGSDFPALDGDTNADVCVIGLGGSGLACINELCVLGLRVVGIDAARIASGAAGRNGGFLLAGVARFYHDAVASYGRERAKRMYELSLREIEHIAAVTPESVRLSGSLRLAESSEEEADCVAHRDALRADGFACETYDGPEGRGLLIPGDGSFDPLARCRTLAQAALANGARLYERTPALRIESGCVTTVAGAVQAPSTVIAVDGRLDVLVPQLASEVRTARLQMLATAPTDEVSIARPVYARWGYDYWQQRPDGTIALGGARDAGGEAEWTHDTRPTPVVQEALERRLRDVLGVNAPITHRWGASVSYTSDGLPIVREVQPGVWTIGAYSGTGNVIGSVLGRGVARMIARNDRTLIEPFLRG